MGFFDSLPHPSSEAVIHTRMCVSKLAEPIYCFLYIHLFRANHLSGLIYEDPIPGEDSSSLSIQRWPIALHPEVGPCEISPINIGVPAGVVLYRSCRDLMGADPLSDRRGYLTMNFLFLWFLVFLAPLPRHVLSLRCRG